MENKKSLFSAIPPAIIAGIIIGMITYFGLNFAGYKEYEAQSKVVTTNIENIDDANNVAQTYAATITSPKIKQRTLETLEIDWNVGKLDSKLDIKPVENTAIIDIVVHDTNKLRAEDIADQYADYTVRVINNIYNSGAQVMEYAYGSASTVDNTMKYALTTGGIGFLLWMLLKMIGINRYNSKLQKTETPIKSKEVREVKEKPFKKKKTVVEDSNKEVKEVKTLSTNPNVETKTYGSSDDTGQTRVINKEDIEKATSSKYEVLGRIPSYNKGDLDV